MNKFEVEILGRACEVRFTTRAINAMEKELGYSVLSSKFIDDNSIDKKVKMLWAGLLHEGFSVDEVYDGLDSGALLLSATSVATKAFNHFWGLDEQHEEAPDLEKKTGSL